MSFITDRLHYYNPLNRRVQQFIPRQTSLGNRWSGLDARWSGLDSRWSGLDSRYQSWRQASNILWPIVVTRQETSMVATHT
jgi:hypothetical protein